MQGRQVGAPQIEREVVTRNRTVEIDGPQEVEVEVGVARRDQTVEPAVAQPAVEPQRIVGVTIEFEVRNVALHIGIGHAAPHRTVERSRERSSAQQRAAAEQGAQLEIARGQGALQPAAPAAQRLHSQVDIGVSDLRRQCGLQVERRERTLEPQPQSDASGPPEHGGQIGRQGVPGDVAGESLDIVGRSSQPGNIEIERRGADIGQAHDPGLGRQRSLVPDPQTADRSAEIGDLAGDRSIDIAQDQPHQPDEILVIGPRIADQRNVGNRHVRPLGKDRSVLETETTVGQVEAAGQPVEHETAALACRKRTDGGMDGLAVDREVVDMGHDVVKVHVPEVDAERRIAPHLPLQAQLHILDRSLADGKAEIAFLGTVGIGNAVDDLLDVHLPVGRLAQTELRTDDFAAAERHAAAEKAQTGHVSVEPVDVKERIALVILDVETVDLDLAQQADVDPADGDRGLQLVGDRLHGFLHHEILHSGNIQQQRNADRQDDRQQNDRREHLSQYFYTFVHE